MIQCNSRLLLNETKLNWNNQSNQTCQDLQMIFFLLELLTEAVLFLKREGLGWGKKKLFAKKKKKNQDN